jgi:hypothetical protein
VSAIRDGLRSRLDAVIAAYETNDYDALERGYAPVGGAVKDFSLVRHRGRWHLFHILAREGLTCLSPDAEHRVGHASSADFVTWTTHDPVLPALPGTWESHHVFAPHVFAWHGRFHMVYAGINRSMYECLGWAESDDLFAWHRCPKPFLDPRDLPWADADRSTDRDDRSATPCRDPHVVAESDRCTVYFSTVERGSGLPVVGAVNTDDGRLWEDAGVVARGWDGSWDAASLLESSCIHRLDSGRWMLAFNTRGKVRYVVTNDRFSFHGGAVRVLPTQEPFVSLELLARRDDRWLVAYFGGTQGLRMSLGVLQWKGDEVLDGRRIGSPKDLAEFEPGITG